MTANEFVKIVRKGSDKLRVDNIVLDTGEQQFHGSGTLQIEQARFKLRMQLNEGEKLPELHSGIFTKKDSWKLKGVIEYDLEFKCDAVSPAGSGCAFGTWRMFGLHPIYLIPSGWDAMSSREQSNHLAQIQKENNPIVENTQQEQNRVENSPEEDLSVRFDALLFEYPFFEPFCGRELKGEIEGFDFTLKKENDDADLWVSLKSKKDYISQGEKEDWNKFYALMAGLAFTNGAHAWPYRIEHWRSGQKITDMVRSADKLTRISHGPFTDNLAFHAGVVNKNWNYQDILKKATAFFEANSTLSKEVSQMLFLLREADANEVHSDITMIALCALFENLVQLLFRELKLEENAKNVDGTFKDAAFQSFVQAKEKIKTQINEQIIAVEDEGWKRMTGVVWSADPFSTPKKFQAVLDQLQFDPQWRKDMELAFKTWYEARQHLFHYKERISQSEEDLKKAIFDQCQIAGAINVLLLKLIGYSGLMRASTFEGKYR
jgi:hypothetical protein